MKLKSPVFTEGHTIPKLFTGEGGDISPPLAWSDVPAGCKSLALTCEDPDAAGGTFIHWVVYNISPKMVAFSEGVKNLDQGRNSFDKQSYGGPMPPKGHGKHHYIFTLYALDSDLKLKPGLSYEELVSAIKNRVISKAKLIGIYERMHDQKTA